MASLLLLTFLGLLAFHLFIRYRRIGRLSSRVPGPAPYPFVGNMLSFNISSEENIWDTIRHVSNKWYPITRIWCSTTSLFCVRHPYDLEILLSSPRAIEKAWTYHYLHPWLKTGLLTSGGEKWKQRRKILTPAFHFNIINKYMTITEEQGQIFIESLRAEGKETIKSLIPMSSNLTLNIICESAMGVSFNDLDSKTIEKYKDAIYKLGNIVVYRMPRPYLRDWMMKLLPFWKIVRELNRALKVLHEFTNKVVKERKQYHESTGYRYLQEFTDGDDESVNVLHMRRRKKMAMLDLLLLAERDGLIDEEGVKEEVDTFSFEGHDTSAMSMTFTLMLLAANQSAQDEARAEVTEIINKNDGKFGIAQLQECEYLERCIKESLRLYPPVATIFRKVDDGTELQLKHALLPFGSSVILPIYDTHRDPNFWTDPENFDPDRFLPEQSKGRHPFAYIPFSAGFRNCIGQKFAMNELKSLVGRILYNFYLEPVDRLEDVKMIADLVLRPSKPVHVKFVRINEN